MYHTDGLPWKGEQLRNKLKYVTKVGVWRLKQYRRWWLYNIVLKTDEYNGWQLTEISLERWRKLIRRHNLDLPLRIVDILLEAVAMLRGYEGWWDELSPLLSRGWFVSQTACSLWTQYMCGTFSVLLFWKAIPCSLKTVNHCRKRKCQMFWMRTVNAQLGHEFSWGLCFEWAKMSISCFYTCFFTVFRDRMRLFSRIKCLSGSFIKVPSKLVVEISSNLRQFQRSRILIQIQQSSSNSVFDCKFPQAISPRTSWSLVD